MNDQAKIMGVILAGGLAKRMGGGDKCLLPLSGKTLLQRSIERAQPQLGKVLLNANGNNLRFARSRLTVVNDIFIGNPGPLAGIHAALSWMSEHQPDEEWLASLACDTPFFPTDFVARLHTAAQEADTRIAVATSNGRVHPIFSVWHTSLLGKITQVLNEQDHPRLQEWLEAQNPAYVDFSLANYDPFFNINTPQDLYSAEAQLPHVS